MSVTCVLSYKDMLAICRTETTSISNLLPLFAHVCLGIGPMYLVALCQTLWLYLKVPEIWTSVARRGSVNLTTARHSSPYLCSAAFWRLLCLHIVRHQHGVRDTGPLKFI